MRYSNTIKSGTKMEASHEERFRKEFVRAFNDGQIYGVPIKKGKRYRSAFTTEQVHYLEKEFRKYPYIGNARRKDVANVLDIPERAVKIWFQNRRMKEKKETLNKETESEKSDKVKEQLINVCGLPSTNNISLPVLTVTSPTSVGNSVDVAYELKHKNIDATYQNRAKDLTHRKGIFSTDKKENPSVIQSNPITTTAELLYGAKKYKTEKNDNVSEEMCVGEKSSADLITSTNEVRQSLPSPQYFGGHQNLGYPLYTPPSAVPQDLSSKPLFQTQKVSEQNNFSSTDVPFYMPYAAPYMTQGNVVWKPVNMTPIMASPPVPPLTLSTGSVPHSNILRRNCTCDCHKSFIAPMMLQNQPHSNVQ